jgi:hypothetical protein
VKYQGNGSRPPSCTLSIAKHATIAINASGAAGTIDIAVTSMSQVATTGAPRQRRRVPD